MLSENIPMFCIKTSACFTIKHPHVFTQNIRMFCIITSPCFYLLHGDVFALSLVNHILSSGNPSASTSICHDRTIYTFHGGRAFGRVWVYAVRAESRCHGLSWLLSRAVMLLQVLYNGAVHDVGIDLRCLHTLVPQQLLHGCYVHAIIYK